MEKFLNRKRFYDMTDEEKVEHLNNQILEEILEFYRFEQAKYKYVEDEAAKAKTDYFNLMVNFPHYTIKLCKQLGLNGEQTIKKLGDILKANTNFNQNSIDDVMMELYYKYFEDEFEIKHPKEYAELSERYRNFAMLAG